MRIAHLSDFHFTRMTFNPLRLFSKRGIGMLNWLFLRRSGFDLRHLDPIPQLLQEQQVDLVLLGGDFTTTALQEEFEKAQEFVQKIKTPWIAIPGNHDCYTYRSARQFHFYRYFVNRRRQILHPVEFFTLKQHRVEAHHLINHWWLVALDTAVATNPYSSEGTFLQEQQNHLQELFSLLPRDASILLFNHYPFFQNDERRRNLRRAECLMQCIQKEPRIRLYLHGHTHRHILADLRPNQLPIVLDSGSATQKNRGSWNLIDLQEHGCQITPYHWQGSWKRSQTETFLWQQ